MGVARVLLLLRHAEAQAMSPGATDFDRALSERGREQARGAARRILRADLRPDLLLASPAARTRETAQIVELALGLGPSAAGRMLLPPELYLAEVPALLAAVRGCGDAVQTLLLVGHNPGLTDLAAQLLLNAARGSAARGSGGDAIDLGLGALCRLTVQAPSWRMLDPAAVSAAALL